MNGVENRHFDFTPFIEDWITNASFKFKEIKNFKKKLFWIMSVHCVKPITRCPPHNVVSHITITTILMYYSIVVPTYTHDLLYSSVIKSIGTGIWENKLESIQNRFLKLLSVWIKITNQWYFWCG